MDANEPGIDARQIEEVGAGLTPISLDERLREVERQLITWALTATRGNKSKAALLLRIKRSTLADRITRCGIGSDGMVAF